MRLLIDVDGVLAEFTYGFTKLATELGLVEKPWRCHTQKTWAFDFDVDAVWEELKRRYNWWMTLEPLVDVVEIAVLNELIKAHDVYFVTSRPRTQGLSAEKQTEYWLAGIGIHTAGASVIATKTGTKGALAKALDINLGWDDHLGNLEDLTRADILAVSRPWRYNEAWWGIQASSVHSFNGIVELSQEEIT